MIASATAFDAFAVCRTVDWHIVYQMQTRDDSLQLGGGIPNRNLLVYAVVAGDILYFERAYRQTYRVADRKVATDAAAPYTFASANDMDNRKILSDNVFDERHDVRPFGNLLRAALIVFRVVSYNKQMNYAIKISMLQ